MIRLLTNKNVDYEIEAVGLGALDPPDSHIICSTALLKTCISGNAAVTHYQILLVALSFFKTSYYIHIFTYEFRPHYLQVSYNWLLVVYKVQKTEKENLK